MKIKVITSYKPGTWNEYAKRAVDSVLEHWPANTDVAVYHESQTQDIFEHPRVEWLDAHEVQPELLKFKSKYKDDPVANGEIQEIPNGVRRPGPMPEKGSFQWNAVRFSNKIFCVTHAIKSSAGYDYVIWLDADTYSFRPMPENFLEKLLPGDSLITYLGRGDKDPECGFVGYNLRHPEIQNLNKDWEELYISDGIFKLTSGWTDCSSLIHLSNKYQKQKNIKVNDIGHAGGVKGHHVFINSVLGLYMDHFKGKRKKSGTSWRKDLSPQSRLEIKDIAQLDYWKQIKN
tara:strand:+ start:41 stop:904 length:864 start_codon:yes stop_codon:yes gene_type:complete